MQFALLLLSVTNQLYLIGENGNGTIIRKINLISEYFLLIFFIAKQFFHIIKNIILLEVVKNVYLFCLKYLKS